MNLKTLPLVLSIIALFASFSFAQIKNETSPLITIERKSCFGSCPAYSAEIFPDGTVNYHGKYDVRITGDKSHRIANVLIEKLIKAFEDINYFSLKDEYRFDENGLSYTDLPTTITSLSLNGKYKRIVNYYGAPMDLDKLEDKIDQLGDIYQYIGPA